MKTFILILSFTLASAMCLAQTPGAFNYQAVVRNLDGSVIGDQNIGVQIEILEGNMNGNAVFTETHLATSNSFGLISLEIGRGSTSDDFSAISWGAADHFLRVAIDTEGGSNFTVLGTNQILAVPYALHSGVSDSTLNESQELAIDGNILTISDGNSVTIPTAIASGTGNSMLTLFGDISDAEAAQKILQEAGTITSHVWIENTTILSTVDLSALESLVELRIRKNASLSDLNLAGLQNCKTIIIDENPNLTSCNLSSLAISNYVFIAENDILATLDLGLEFVTTLGFLDNPSLQSLDLSSTRAEEISFNNCGILSLSLPGITSGTDLIISDCQQLESIEVPNSTDFSKFSLSTCPQLNSVAMPKLVTSSELLYFNACDLLASIDLSKLNSVLDIGIFNCPLTTLSLSSLTDCRILNISNCSQLSSVDIPNLAAFEEVSLRNNALPSSIVNSVLAQFVAIDPPIQSRLIRLQGQTPPAPPTGQGIADKETLITNFNSVSTD